MHQLELFPRMELRSLLDFQRVETSQLSLQELKKLIRCENFFISPKANSLIQSEHSSIVDKILRFRIQYIEEMLIEEARGFNLDASFEKLGADVHHGAQTWVGLNPHTLQTPYSECLKILQLLNLKPYQQIIDLGAAYGRMGIIVGGLYIKNSFTGLEYVKARADEGNRVYNELGIINSKLVHQNLYDPRFELPEADIYFIYDFGQIHHIEHTLNQLKCIAKRRPIKIIVRGEFTRKIIREKHSWPSLQYEGRPDQELSIYSAYKS